MVSGRVPFAIQQAWLDTEVIFTQLLQFGTREPALHKPHSATACLVLTAASCVSMFCSC